MRARVRVAPRRRRAPRGGGAARGARCVRLGRRLDSHRFCWRRPAPLLGWSVWADFAVGDQAISRVGLVHALSDPPRSRSSAPRWWPVAAGAGGSASCSAWPAPARSGWAAIWSRPPLLRAGRASTTPPSTRQLDETTTTTGQLNDNEPHLATVKTTRTSCWSARASASTRSPTPARTAAAVERRRAGGRVRQVPLARACCASTTAAWCRAAAEPPTTCARTAASGFAELAGDASRACCTMARDALFSVSPARRGFRARISWRFLGVQPFPPARLGIV